MPLNSANPETLNLLLNRRSVKTKDMVEPGPSHNELTQILTAAARVPDHGKLVPWRFIVVDGDERSTLGNIIADALAAESDVSEKVREKMKGYGTQAPTCIIAIYSPSCERPVPVWEQHLSTGAACQNLLIAAHALGYVGQWLTGWAAYSKTVWKELGLHHDEMIAGFIFLGSQSKEPSERPRPDMDTVIKWGLPK